MGHAGAPLIAPERVELERGGLGSLCGRVETRTASGGSVGAGDGTVPELSQCDAGHGRVREGEAEDLLKLVGVLSGL